MRLPSFFSESKISLLFRSYTLMSKQTFVPSLLFNGKQSTHEAYFEITADRFLRNMVRAAVGTLLEVGLGKIKPEEFKSILGEMDRQAAAVSVPAHGLFLWKVDY